jgi:hypothetical protein
VAVIENVVLPAAQTVLFGGLAEIAAAVQVDAENVHTSGKVKGTASLVVQLAGFIIAARRFAGVFEVTVQLYTALSTSVVRTRQFVEFNCEGMAEFDEVK